MAHTAGTEADFSQNVDGMKVAHTAGTETEFSKNVDGMKVARTAGTETKLFENVDGMKVAHPAGSETEFPKKVDGMKVAHTAGTEARRSNLKQSSSLFEADGAARRNARSDSATPSMLGSRACQILSQALKLNLKSPLKISIANLH